MEKQISINGRNYYFVTRKDDNYPRTHVFLRSDEGKSAEWIAHSIKHFDRPIYSSIESLEPSDCDLDDAFRKMVRDVEFGIVTAELGIIEFNDDEE